MICLFALLYLRNKYLVIFLEMQMFFFFFLAEGFSASGRKTFGLGAIADPANAGSAIATGFVYELQQSFCTRQLHIKRIPFHCHLDSLRKHLKDRLYLMMLILSFSLNIQIRLRRI